MIILNKKKLKNEYPNINNEVCFLFNERFFSKINKGTKQDLYTSYRLDFDIREKLNQFKKKYRDILL